MKTKFQVLAFLILLAFQSPAQQQDLLSGKFTANEWRNKLISQATWTPFPKPGDRAGWAKADREMLATILKEAESYLNYEWPSIPATKSLLFERTGDRNEYQSLSFKKPSVLGVLLLAEVYENKGRFLDAIIDGVWSICEESFWGVPAHLPKTKEIAGLMDTSNPFVDLF